MAECFQRTINNFLNYAEYINIIIITIHILYAKYEYNVLM